VALVSEALPLGSEALAGVLMVVADVVGPTLLVSGAATAIATTAARVITSETRVAEAGVWAWRAPQGCGAAGWASSGRGGPAWSGTPAVRLRPAARRVPPTAVLTFF